MDEEKLPAEPARPAEEAPQESEAPVRHEWDEPFEKGEFLRFAQPAPRPSPDRPEKKRRKKPPRFRARPAASAAVPPRQPENGDPDRSQLRSDRVIRLAQVRRRRKLRRLRWIIAITLVLAFALAWTMGAFGTSLAALSDFTDTILIGLTPGDGFPVKTNIPEIYQVEELNGGFVELGSQDLVLYSASGARLRNIQHNYARPALTTGHSRFCVYARSGNELRVESRSQTLYTKTTEQPLLLCSMSRNGSLAVVTRSSRYAAELTVYSPTMEYRYGWNPSDTEGIPCRILFSEDSKRLAVACLKVQDGRLTTGLYFLDTGREQLQAVSKYTTATPLQMYWLDASQLLVVFDDHTAVYNALTGEEKCRFEYENGHLLSASYSGRNTVLLFSGEAGIAQGRLVVLNDRMNMVSDTQVDGDAWQALCNHGTVYLLGEDSVQARSVNGEEKWETLTESKPLALVQGKKLLLFMGAEADVLTPPRD